MQENAHLMFPFVSSWLFVVGAMFAKQFTSRGGNAFTVTTLSNSCLAVCWAAVGTLRQDWLPWSAWVPALWIAAAFVIGQLCTYLAFRLGDVSLATPVFGIKIIMVAAISALLADKAITLQIWIAAGVATLGIVVIHGGPQASSHERLSARRVAWSIALAITAAAALSLFDVGLQAYGRQYGAERFLTTMFVLVGVLSLGLLPWCDSPDRIRTLGAWRLLGLAGLFMAVQAISISYSLGRFGDATRVNIVYSLRGLWSVLLAWLVGRWAAGQVPSLPRSTLLFRLTGAILLTLAVVVALA